MSVAARSGSGCGSTVPAPADGSTILPPASARLTPLAQAALENGVAASDVAAYLESLWGKAAA